MQDELEEVAKEWTRVASEDAAVILVQYFERDLVSALANEFLKLDNGWVVTAFEACCAAGARTVVLQRGSASGSGGDTQCVVPSVTLKMRYESQATTGLNYRASKCLRQGRQSSSQMATEAGGTTAQASGAPGVVQL